MNVSVRWPYHPPCMERTMRQNLPVTQQEHVLAVDTTIVTTTDLQGRITYCNNHFIEASGFSREELLGQPHNLVRHPDMPGEAFRDLWRTVASGKPWTGLVKNRRKNGDYYWVVANVTPLFKDGDHVGYMSVRTRPAREQIESAEKLYASMREEAASGRIGVSFEAGRVMRPGLSGMIGAVSCLSITARAGLVFAVVCLCALALERLASNLTGATWGQWVVSMAAILPGVWWIKRGVMTPLREAMMFARAMASGDLTGRLNATAVDEFGELCRALNQLNANLQAVVGDVRGEVEGVAEASRQFAAGSTDLSERTASEAASLEQTAAALDELVGTVRQTADSATCAAETAQQASTLTASVATEVGRVLATMAAIESSSQRISSIVGVIDDLAFQTNILALNAAVEAARAGEAGRSFAVVATEVRVLAQRCAVAARDIKHLIDDSADKIAQGSQVAATVGDAMREVTGSTARVRTLIEEISHATHEQTTGIQQINTAVTHLDGVTQQNAALVEELAASAQSLQQQAVALVDSVQIFQTRTGNIQ